MYSYHPKHDQDFIRCKRCMCGNLQNEDINLVQEPSSNSRCQCPCPCGKERNDDVKLAQEHSNLIHEPPVKDTPKISNDFYNSEGYANANQFPPPEPPNGEYGLWELQFCKWWGWTWVRKGEKEIIQTAPRAYRDDQIPQEPKPYPQQTAPYPQQKQGEPIFFHEQEAEKARGRPPEKKKDGGCCGFGSKKKEEPYQPVDQKNTPPSSNVDPTSESRGRDVKDGDVDDGRNIDGTARMDKGRRSGGKDTLRPSVGELKGTDSVVLQRPPQPLANDICCCCCVQTDSQSAVYRLSEQPAGMSIINATTQTDRDLEERPSEPALDNDWRTRGIQVEKGMRDQATCCYCIPEQRMPPKSDICLCACHQTCYCCDSFGQQVRPSPSSPPTRPRAFSKDMITQTEIETREKATKTSQVNLNKQTDPCYCIQCNRLKRCNVCKLPICYNTQVTRRECPVCVERGCAAKPTYKSAGTCCRQRDKVVNYCLTRTLPKPSYNDLLKCKKTNHFSTMKKSLDILVKNNINIMHLLGNKSFSRGEDDKIPNFLDTNISSLSLDEIAAKSGQEHCTLLTAVCDAILSSHKFDEEKCNPLKPSTSNSTENYNGSRNSTYSFGFLESILNDLNFPMRYKTNNESNLPKDIGVQVNSLKKTDHHIVRPLRKLSRNRSKILTLPMFSKKHDFKSNSDTFKTRRNEKRNFNKSKIGSIISKNDEGKTTKDEKAKSLTTLFKSSDESIFKTTAENRQRFRNIDELLSSIRFNINLPHTSTRNDTFHSIDDTSPPFAEYELPYNALDEKCRRTKDKDSDRS